MKKAISQQRKTLMVLFLCSYRDVMVISDVVVSSVAKQSGK